MCVLHQIDPTIQDGIDEYGKMFYASRIHKYLAYKPDFPDLKAPIVVNAFSKSVCE